MKNSNMVLSLFLLLGLLACKKEDMMPTTINAGNDPNFKIVPNEDGVLEKFYRKVVVFGIDIYAVNGVTDAKLLHAANIMAQYLDNDEDGIPDNQLVVDKMVEQKAFMVMWKAEKDLNIDLPSGRTGQDLGNDETAPNFVTGGRTGQFDAALEEVLHLITHVGYAGVYPDVFGEKEGTPIAKAMDLARGGHFNSIPNNYPNHAWYTYDDKTCDYSCQVTEYTYWALTTILGAQEYRESEIGQEWKLYTKATLEQKDEAAYQLFTNTQYQFPTILPDGTYRH